MTEEDIVKVVQELESQRRAMTEMFTSAVRQVLADQGNIRKMFVDAMAENQNRISMSIRGAEQQDIIHSGKGGAYSLRYNTTLHKLQWIAQATDTDPETSLPWADELWNDVLGGDAVVATLT